MAKVVLISDLKLNEEDLKREMEDESEDSGLKTIDLSELKHKIAPYLKYVGEVRSCPLGIQLNQSSPDWIAFTAEETWWSELRAIKDEIREKVTDEYNRLAEAREDKEAELLESVDEFIKDNEFICMKTQKAKMAHVLDKKPELEEIDKDDLRRKIQDLAAKIEARGLKRNQKKI